MRLLLSTAAALSFCLAASMPRTEAGELFHWLHGNHICQDGNCQAQQTVVKLPAQDIRIETTAPRVVVGESGSRRGHHHGQALGAPLMFGAPILAGQPIVASVFQMQGVSTQSTGSSLLRAQQELEAQHLEVTKLRAAQQAEMAMVDAVNKRIMTSMSSTSVAAAPSTSECTAIQKSLDELTKRVSDIERLLIIHDNVLKDKK